jgi:hypothetical protein
MSAPINVGATVSVFDHGFLYDDAVGRGKSKRKPGPVTGRLKRACRPGVGTLINEN